ncbi:hypothetical protein BJV78DRAFT_669012 [Lactifluus subvellereus]|nr:hypothetical protein BJV78DRAFT_669012 [Lactifluus subvellereus]
MRVVLGHNTAEPQAGDGRRHSYIGTLDGHVLLNIFNLYRLDVRDEDDAESLIFITYWNRERWWYKLVQVCRRWRFLILASPSCLGLHLVCTHGTPVADMLAYSPALPLIINYVARDQKMATEDEEGILLALQPEHRERVRRICLDLPASNLRTLIMAMDGQFPTLALLCIWSRTKGDTSLMLPKTFEAPQLHHLLLFRAALPIGSLLLTTTVGLVTLELLNIPPPAYFHPCHLFTRLSLMPQLEMLEIHFYSPLPNRDVERQLLMTQVTLPNLRRFVFKGVSAYLEGLVARIRAPLLSIFHINFFNQLTFTIPHLLRFMSTSKNLRFSTVRLDFDTNAVILMADHCGEWEISPFRMQVRCRHLDWQVTSAIQIFNAFLPVLSVVEQLTLSHKAHNLSLEQHNELDRIQWRELLRSFNNVKTLRVQNELVEKLARSLRSASLFRWRRR